MHPLQWILIINIFLIRIQNGKNQYKWWCFIKLVCANSSHSVTKESLDYSKLTAVVYRVFFVFNLFCHCLFCLSLVCLCLSFHVSSYRPPFPYCGPSIYHTFAPKKFLQFLFIPSFIRTSVRLPHRHLLSAWYKSGSRQQNSELTFFNWIKGTETSVVEAFYFPLVLYHMD